MNKISVIENIIQRKETSKALAIEELLKNIGYDLNDIDKNIPNHKIWESVSTIILERTYTFLEETINEMPQGLQEIFKPHLESIKGQYYLYLMNNKDKIMEILLAE